MLKTSWNSSVSTSYSTPRLYLYLCHFPNVYNNLDLIHRISATFGILIHLKPISVLVFASKILTANQLLLSKLQLLILSSCVNLLTKVGGQKRCDCLPTHWLVTRCLSRRTVYTPLQSILYFFVSPACGFKRVGVRTGCK